jgi:hypothetical protein
MVASPDYLLNPVGNRDFNRISDFKSRFYSGLGFLIQIKIGFQINLLFIRI